MTFRPASTIATACVNRVRCRRTGLNSLLHPGLWIELFLKVVMSISAQLLNLEWWWRCNYLHSVRFEVLMGEDYGQLGYETRYFVSCYRCSVKPAASAFWFIRNVCTYLPNYTHIFRLPRRPHSSYHRILKLKFRLLIFREDDTLPSIQRLEFFRKRIPSWKWKQEVPQKCWSIILTTLCRISEQSNNLPLVLDSRAILEFLAPSGLIPIFLFFPRRLIDLEWDLLFSERRRWSFCDYFEQRTTAATSQSTVSLLFILPCCQYWKLRIAIS
jgi:hypothetical protein